MIECINEGQSVVFVVVFSKDLSMGLAICEIDIISSLQCDQAKVNERTQRDKWKFVESMDWD